MNPTPAWINRAAEAIDNRLSLREFGWDAEDVADVAAIIAKHVPQPKALEWVYEGGRWSADSMELPCYYVVSFYGDQGWLAETIDSNLGWFETEDAAKAAAFADFCDKLKACYGEGGE